MKTVNEIKQAAENNYKVIMAAVRVYEANDIYEAAEKAHREIEYDFTHKTSNDEWFRRTEAMYKAEANLKRAANAFFKAVGEKPEKWNTAFSVKLAFNKYISESDGFGYIHKPLKDVSLYGLLLSK